MMQDKDCMLKKDLQIKNIEACKNILLASKKRNENNFWISNNYYNFNNIYNLNKNEIITLVSIDKIEAKFGESINALQFLSISTGKFLYFFYKSYRNTFLEYVIEDFYQLC